MEVCRKCKGCKWYFKNEHPKCQCSGNEQICESYKKKGDTHEKNI